MWALAHTQVEGSDVSRLRKLFNSLVQTLHAKEPVRQALLHAVLLPLLLLLLLLPPPSSLSTSSTSTEEPLIVIHTTQGWLSIAFSQLHLVKLVIRVLQDDFRHCHDVKKGWPAPLRVSVCAFAVGNPN